MSISVSKLTKSDIEIITSLVENLPNNKETASAKHLEILLTDDRTYILAAQMDNQVVGYALAYRFPSLYSDDYLAYLYDIEVLPQHRRKGVGRKLVESLLAELKKDDVDELWLGTASDNYAGHALFSKTGGIKSGETFNDYIYKL